MMADKPKAEKSQMERGQEQPVDKKRAQQTSKTEMPQSGKNSGSFSSSGNKNGQP